MFIGTNISYLCNEILKIGVNDLASKLGIAANTLYGYIEAPEKMRIAPPLRTAIINAGIMAHGNDCFVLGIKQHPDIKQVGINYLKLRHQKHLKACHIDTQYYKLYSWKHTGALRNVKSGMNMRELQLMMRHHSLEETQHYLESLGYNTTAEVAKTPEL